MRILRTLVAFFILVLCVIAAPRAAADEARAKVQAAATVHGLAKAGTIRGTKTRAYRIEKPSPEAVEQEFGSPSKGAPLKVGFGRGVPSVAFDWETLPDGATVGSVQVTSESAQSVRAAVRVQRLPDAAILRFQAPGSSELFEVTGESVNETLARNAAAGEKGADAELYWSPLFEGESLVIEIELPAGVERGDVRISVPQVSHLVTSAAKNFEVTTKASASCEVDAMCSASASQMNAVARMVFSAGGGTYTCTGTLLADQDATSTVPYFLSANHCISSQSVASSLTTIWFYRSTACNSSTVGPYKQLAGGAALLYASSNTDTSFMRLNNPPPAGAVYAGWYAGSTALATSVTGLHHPRGDWLKISNGRVNGYLSCTPPVNGSFTCDFGSQGSSGYFDVGWTNGITEPGSSGSGLFRSDGLLIGQLYGGSGTCADPADDIYGRFDVAYNASLKTWLAGNTLTVTKAGTGTGTVASAPSGINCGSTCTAGFASGASVTLTAAAGATSTFTGWSGACSGTGTCVVGMTQARNVTATFSAAGATLTVTSTGSGTVTSNPAGIECGSSCAAAFNAGTPVTLTATPFRDMAFKGWTGACSGLGFCTVTVNGALTVGASFGAKSAASVGVTSSASPSYFGQPVTLRATVNGSSGAASGVMSFAADGGTLCAAVPVAGGLATCTTSVLAVGNRTIVATYSGDASYNGATSAPFTQAILPVTANLSNLSTRGQVLGGNDVMIGGFVIEGAAAKTVVVRAIGPSLGAFGIANALANPTLTLVRSADQSIVATNNDWGSAGNAAQLAATGLAPTHALESAVLVTLPPGAYTAIISGVGGATGIGMFEVFEVDHADVPLVNMSTRGVVGNGGNVMIGGLVVQGTGPKTVVIRARGPSLAQFGIANALANPSLQLVRAADNTVIASNDNWGSALNAAQLQASGFAPSNAFESAILVTLNPGAYTAIVSGAGGASGVAIIEVYATQ